MIKQSLDINEAHAILTKLRELNLETVSKVELENLIKGLNKHVAVVGNLPIGRVIIRSVSCKYLQQGEEIIFPTKIKQLSFNPNSDQCGFNRASWQGETAFYGSVSTDNLKPYETSSLEVLADLQRSPSYLDRERFVIGKWVVTKDIPLIHISGNLKNNAQAVSSRNDTLYTSISQFPEQMIALKMIDSFLCEEFSKEVPYNEKWRYKISAAYAGFVKEDRWPGIVYSSLRSDGAGYNIVLFPEFVDQFISFERAALTTYYKRGIHIGNEFTMEAFPDGENLKWKEVYIHRMHPKMKQWYTGKSDDNSFEQYISYTDL